MNSIRMPVTVLALGLLGVNSDCPGSYGDSLCRIVGGPSSFCSPQSWQCKGTTTFCGCDFTATTLPKTTLIPSLAPQSEPTSSILATTLLPSSKTTTAPAASTSAEATTTTVAPTQITNYIYDGAPMFIWAEWPDIHGAAAYVAYFGKLLRYVSTSRIPINQIVLRITNPQLGAVDNLFNVSTDSIVYKELLSKLPASVDLMMYPYLLASADQAVWKGISGTTALEGVFKYTSQWNRLLGETRFKGVVVDGEEKVGFASDMASAPAYKTKYGVPIFGYTTGYPQVGDLTKYAPSVDLFYLEMYDFYVENSPTLKLVQNTDTATPQDFAAKLDSQVWLHAINSYDDPRIMFMWSLQNSASSACIYPLNGSCGSKEDFGTQSIDYFMSFIAEVKTRYPPKFGNKPHGMFQFNFMPTSWFST